MKTNSETWLCVNEDGQYVVFDIPEGKFIDYIECKDEVYRFALCWLDNNNVLCVSNYGVPVNERYFATNLQGLDPGDKVKLKD